MDKFDDIIKKAVKQDINIPIKYDNMIYESIKKLDTRRNNKMQKLIRILTGIITTLIGITGVVYAGTVVYKKIWVEPKEYTEYEDLVGTVIPPNEISNEEKEKIISESDAEEIGLKFIKSIGYIDEQINKIELKRAYDALEKTYYLLKTEETYESGLQIHIDSSTGEIVYFNDLNLKNKYINEDYIPQEKAELIAYETLNKLNIKEHYNLTIIEKANHEINQRNNVLWKAIFNKSYGEVYNQYEEVLISFIVDNGKVMYDTINVLNEKFEENEMIITKEEAIEIAKQKEMEMSDVEITSLKAKLAIKKSNTNIYALENNIYNDDVLNGGTYLAIPSIIRKVWEIKIEHNCKLNREDYADANQYSKENDNKLYYIDATTGEIIGGEILLENQTYKSYT